MTGEEFHNKSAGGSQFIATETNARHDGRNKLRPSRVMHAARCGVTLVELMISMLILTIVCISWLQILGIQSARKEARRREAVERLVGMMDAFLYMGKSGKIGNTSIRAGNYYKMQGAGSVLSVEVGGDVVTRIFDGDVSPIGYQLSVVAKKDLPNAARFGDNWGNCKWLVGKLYNHSNCSVGEAGKPFFVLPVCLGL